MASAVITIAGNVVGLPTGSKSLNTIISSGTAVGQTTDVVLQSGDNTITVPANTTAVLIVPPSSNTVALKLKGASGDTGFPLNPAQPSMPSIASGTTSFIINAASLTTGSTEISFI